MVRCLFHKIKNFYLLKNLNFRTWKAESILLKKMGSICALVFHLTKISSDISHIILQMEVFIQNQKGMNRITKELSRKIMAKYFKQKKFSLKGLQITHFTWLLVKETYFYMKCLQAIQYLGTPALLI